MTDHKSPSSSITRARQKRYHRRSARACDECRLRKCKCDGKQPCGPCDITGNDCTYDPNPVPVQKPTLKVRELETRLRSIRTLTQEVRAKANQYDIPEISAALAALEESIGLASDVQSSPLANVSTPRSDENDSHLLVNMMGTGGRGLSNEPGAEPVYGPISIFSFICRSLELFQHTPQHEPNDRITYQTICALFDTPTSAAGISAGEAPGPPSVSSTQLPDQQSFIKMLEAAFIHCQPLGRLFQRSELQAIAMRYYQDDLDMTSKHPSPSYSLLHAVLGLSYLFDADSHQYYGCEQQSRIAMHHFTTASDNINRLQSPSILEIQTLLCLVIFLANTSRVGQAHRYLGMAYSAAVRLGLPHTLSVETSLSHQARDIRIYSLLLEFDTYISLLLDLPQFTNVQSRQPSAMKPFPTVQHIMHDVSAPGRILSFDIDTELAKAHVELMIITSQALQKTYHAVNTWSNDAYGTSIAAIEESTLKEIDLNFRSWMKRLRPLLARAEKTPSFRSYRPRLESTFYLSQLALYYPFLHYLIPSGGSKSMYSHQSQVALSCIKIASTTILRFAKLHDSAGLLPVCWTTVHGVFVSVLCLMFLIAAHEGTSRPGEAWRRAELGIRLLASMRCADRGANACLDIIKMLVSRLKHTVDFDMQLIEATTPPLCRIGMQAAGQVKITRSSLPTPDAGSPYTQTSPPAYLKQHKSTSFSIQDLLIHEPVEVSLLSPPTSTPATQPSNRVIYPGVQHASPSALWNQSSPSSSTNVISPSERNPPPPLSTLKTPTAIDTVMTPLTAPSGSNAGADNNPFKSPVSGASMSLSSDADGILAQAQESAQIIDFDMFFDLS